MRGARVVAYNLWRAITPPPQNPALALCDLRTVRGDQLVRAESIGGRGAPQARMEFYVLRHDPDHRWCWFSNLQPDELLVFQQFDTAAAGPSGCPHTAFLDPRCPPGAPARASLEARAYAVFA